MLSTLQWGWIFAARHVLMMSGPETVGRMCVQGCLDPAAAVVGFPDWHAALPKHFVHQLCGLHDCSSLFATWKGVVNGHECPLLD